MICLLAQLIQLRLQRLRLCQGCCALICTGLAGCLGRARHAGCLGALPAGLSGLQLLAAPAACAVLKHRKVLCHGVALVLLLLGRSPFGS